MPEYTIQLEISKIYIIFQEKLMKMRSAVFWIVTTVYAGVCQREPCTKVRIMTSVKPFKSKNHDKIDLDDKNPNLKKVLIEIFVRWKILGSSNKISSANLYLSCMELSIQ